TYWSWRLRPSCARIERAMRTASISSGGTGRRSSRSSATDRRLSPSACRASISRLRCDLLGSSARTGSRGRELMTWGTDCAAMIPARPRVEPMHPPESQRAMFEYDQARLREIAQAALGFAREFGATGAAVDVSENSGLSVNVRKGRIETIEQNRDKGLGVTVYSGQRMGHASSTDFSLAALRETANAAWQIARFTAEDPCAGLPDRDALATGQPDLKVFHHWPITVDEAVDIAKRTERAALATSPMITNSEGASVSVSHGHFVAANSLGFVGGYRYSRHSIAC